MIIVELAEAVHVRVGHATVLENCSGTRSPRPLPSPRANPRSEACPHLPARAVAAAARRAGEGRAVVHAQRIQARLSEGVRA